MKKLFFMHIPKTGGTSLEAYLREQYAFDSIFPKFKFRDFSVTDLDNIKNYSLVMGHYDIRVLNYLPQDCIKATIFREPVSLTISALKHAMMDRIFCPPRLNLEGKSLQQIIRDEGILLQFCNLQTGYLSSLPYFKSYPDISVEEFGTDGINLDFDRALSNLQQFEFIGIFEKYDESLNCLAELCDLYQPRIKPRLNVSLSNSDNVLTIEDLEIVRKYNKLDIKLYKEACRLNLIHHQQSKEISGIEGKIKCFPLEIACNYISKQPFYGYGFHKIEGSSGKCYRWTGPETLSGVTFNGSRVANCEFIVKYYFINNHASTLDFYINGVSIKPDISEALGLYTAKIFYDNLTSYSGRIDLEFKTDIVIGTSTDLRKLGLVISNISVTSFELLE